MLEEQLPESLEPLLDRLIDERLRRRQVQDPNLVWENVEAGGSSGGRRSLGQRLLQPDHYNSPRSFGSSSQTSRTQTAAPSSSRPSVPLAQRFSNPLERDPRPLARRIENYESIALEASPTPLSSRIGERSAGAENPILIPAGGGNPATWGYNHVPDAFWYHALGLAIDDPDWHRVIRLERNGYLASLATEPPHRGPWTFPQLYRRFLKRHNKIWIFIDSWRDEMRAVHRGLLSPIPPGHAWHRDLFYADSMDLSERAPTAEDQDWLINVMHTGNARRSVAGPIIERFAMPSRFIPSASSNEQLHVTLSDDEGIIESTELAGAAGDDDETMDPPEATDNSPSDDQFHDNPVSSSSLNEYDEPASGSPVRSEDLHLYDG